PTQGGAIEPKTVRRAVVLLVGTSDRKTGSAATGLAIATSAIVARGAMTPRFATTVSAAYILLGPPILGLALWCHDAYRGHVHPEYHVHGEAYRQPFFPSSGFVVSSAFAT